MSFIGLLLVAGVGGYLFYFFGIRPRENDTPVMRKFYGYLPGETLARMWPNGLLWLRPISETEKAMTTAGNVAGILLGFQVVSVFDTFALSLTIDGVFILNDNRKDGNVGTIRFRQQDIRFLTRLHQENNQAASGVGKFEPAFDVELTLNTGQTFWIQIPQSAYDAMSANAN